MLHFHVYVFAQFIVTIQIANVSHIFITDHTPLYLINRCIIIYLFGFVQFILQGLFGHLHLYEFLSQLLVLLLRLRAFLLHLLQLVVETNRHIFCHLRGETPQFNSSRPRRSNISARGRDPCTLRSCSRLLSSSSSISPVWA